MRLALGDGPVLDSPRNNNELALVHSYGVIAILHRKRAADHEKQLVFVVVLVPHKRA